MKKLKKQFLAAVLTAVMAVCAFAAGSMYNPRTVLD